jgi:hypothetical protein
VAWRPTFEEVSPSTLQLTNTPSETGVILPFHLIQFKHPGPKGNERYSTRLVGRRGSEDFYFQYTVWPPNNTDMTEAHWHRELRTEVMIFGDGYWMGSGPVVDHKYRTRMFPGDFFIEAAGGWHFGWSDPGIPENNVMFFFGTEPIVDEPMSKDLPPEKHVQMFDHTKIEWEPPQGLGPMIFRLLGDASKAGWYNEFNRWRPGDSRIAHTHPDDRYGVVVSGMIYMGFGDGYDPSKARRMTTGTFFTQPAGMGHFMYVPIDQKDDAVVLMYGQGPSKMTLPRAMEPRGGDDGT